MVAKWQAKPEKSRMNCKLCKLLTSPQSFALGSQVHIAEVGNCETCEVALSTPSSDNEPIMELYNMLPQNFDGFSGYRIISFSDIMGLFDLIGVLKELREDFYFRLKFFHEQLISAIEAIREAHSGGGSAK